MIPLTTAQLLLQHLGVSALTYRKTGRNASYTKKGPGRRHKEGKQ